jgi:solute carrier family 45, member 1/2/4
LNAHICGILSGGVESIILARSRNQSQLSAFGSIKDIWSNIFTLPQAIRSICFAQFFAWIGWFPILFFTSVWVGEIYIREAIANGADPNDPSLVADATRAGSRALFLNAVVNLISSIFLPFLVHASGIQPTSESPPSTAAIKRAHENQMNGRWSMVNSRSWVGRMVDKRPSWARLTLPIPGFTLIRVWIMGQAVFAVAMFCTL